MKKALLLLTFLVTTNLWAKTELMVGDILLQPLDCMACDLIEEEEDTIYSHMGIVISINPVMVADSRRKVEVQTLKDFNSITEKGQSIRVLRFQNDKVVKHLTENAKYFRSLFASDFDGLPYDHEFLWNNLNPDGTQKLYCSEMVAKLLQAFLGIDPIVKRMHFTQNRDQWERYFQGNVPDGQWGNSPGDFERSDLFYTVGDL